MQNWTRLTVTCKPVHLDYTSQNLILSDLFCKLYFFVLFWRKDPGSLMTYLTFPSMNNHNFAVCTNCPFRVHQTLFNKLQMINLTTHSKKAKSFWQSYGSVVTIIDNSFMYSLFGQHKQCELKCKTSANHNPYLNHFPTFHSRVILHTSASGQILNYLVLFKTKNCTLLFLCCTLLQFQNRLLSFNRLKKLGEVHM